MTHRKYFAVIFISLAILLVGQGCQKSEPSWPEPIKKPTEQNSENSSNKQIPKEMGFGKIPKPGSSISATGNNLLGSAKAISSITPLPMPSESNTAVYEQVATKTNYSASSEPAIGRVSPIPAISTYPVTIEYSIEAAIPSWDAMSDVLQLKPELPQASLIAQITKQAGLPTQSFNETSDLNSINLGWQDAEKFIWSFDASNKFISFWKNVPNQNYDNQAAEYKKPMLDRNELTTIASDFLNKHGFSWLTKNQGTIMEDLANIQSLEYRCPMYDADDTNVSSGSSGGQAKPEIYPMPRCYWPTNITVVFGGSKEGRPLVYQDGSPSNSASIVLDYNSKKVLNGNIQLDQKTNRSSYPLIDKETAKKRLQSGGLNPVWPWGDETGTIKVKISNINLVWMRYDAWQDNHTITYYLPALATNGTIDRSKNSPQEEIYNTVIPLLDDSAFEEIPPSPSPMPIPILQRPDEPVSEPGLITKDQ